MQVEKLFSTIDTHVAGEPFRIIINSPMTLDVDVMTLNPEAIDQKFKHVKDLLLNEPRGYQGMNGCIVMPSKTADYACLFVQHGHKAAFTYSGLVATITALLETGNIAKHDNQVYQIETVYGIYSIEAVLEHYEVRCTRFACGECQVIDSNKNFKTVQIDGSRQYLMYTLPDSIPSISMEHLSAIMKWGKQTTQEIRKQHAFAGIILTEPVSMEDHAAVRSVTFKKDGSILRSPGADSTFAILEAWLQESSHITTLTNQSIFNSTMTAELTNGTNHRFSMETQAFVTGMNQFIADQTDPLQHGFLLK
ncbi:hypothetical protein CFK37_09320 [Virgibacillus phasianinus]|uniref:Proline racemase n=1 Tax=Virgibacillus phasianinus TaxID=2017483 RepID=A0A220U3D9_9BACI|nr:proline racemase family protein [Virgibacillus phasianinus]ASK62341.1 hypothetical protein CFK37_09320 [Virgibacillus phasianinus]